MQQSEIITILLAILINNAYSGTIPSDGNSEFAVDLFTKISATKKNENVLISPFSVRTCLALVYAGSSGETAEEFAKGLHLQKNDKSLVNEQFKSALSYVEENPFIQVANKIYVKSGQNLNPNYKNIIENFYKSEIELVDFSDKEATVNKINNWVKNKTNRKIQNILDQSKINEFTKTILLNAVYFKANWSKQFDHVNTRKTDFWTTPSTSTKVDMMYQNDNFNYAELPSLEAKAVELSYDKSDLSFLIILPNSRNGLEDLEKKLHTVHLLNLDFNYIKVDLKIPKFKIEFLSSLNEQLKMMGIKKAFTNDAEIFDIMKESLIISDVLHKTFIKVDEKGTEAAGVTAIRTYVHSGQESIKFFADHPFIYVVKSPTQIYFIGKFVTPTQMK